MPISLALVTMRVWSGRESAFETKSPCAAIVCDVSTRSISEMILFFFLIIVFGE